jgi:Mycothiol maleylpyruvate isomerase N-terminal domain
MDTWTSIKNGRGASGDYLAGLSADDWDKPSLCAGWAVKNVAAHMLVIPTMPLSTTSRTSSRCSERSSASPD